MTHGRSPVRLLAGPLRLLHRLLPLLLVPLVLGACGGGPTDDAPEPTLSREVFISTYVDLRMAALRNPDTEITTEERERILAEHEVSSGELLRFVEVVSRDDPRAMQEIWAEVQDRIRRAREEAVLQDEVDDPPDDAGDTTDSADSAATGMDSEIPQRTPGSTSPMLRASWDSSPPNAAPNRIVARSLITMSAPRSTVNASSRSSPGGSGAPRDASRSSRGPK